VNARQVLVVLATGALFLVMALSFLGNVNWPDTPTAIPVYNETATSSNGIANQLFNAYAITVLLIAILLGAAMIGGVYLAKMDEPGKVGP